MGLKKEYSEEKILLAKKKIALAHLVLNGLASTFVKAAGGVLILLFALNAAIFASGIGGAEYVLQPEIILYSLGLFVVGRFLWYNAKLAQHYVSTKSI